jgi:hypothetical protein
MVVKMALVVGLLGSFSWALAGAPAADAQAPVRSGAVAGGPIDSGPGARCEIAPDCAAWLASRCERHLAGLNPGAESSIVDVRDLAGRRTERRFVVFPGTSRGMSTGLVIGGFRIEFWDSSCNQINRYDPPLESGDVDPSTGPYVRTQSRFKIPAGTVWMTAVADDNVLVRWELY